jgi:deoxyadenosine/deoxycytidine kinase
MKKFIAIAGNIGAGKTTLARKLAEKLNWDLYEEPFSDNPYLERFYNDMKTWAFHTETSFLSHRLKHHLEILNNPSNIIQDRCLYEGAEVFVRNLFNSGHLNEVDWNTYNHLYNNIKHTLTPPNLIVYIKSSPNRCLAMTKKRGRDIDKDISVNYMHDLHELYEDWEKTFKLCPILRIDADLNNYIFENQAFESLCGEILRNLDK